MKQAIAGWLRSLADRLVPIEQEDTFPIDWQIYSTPTREIFGELSHNAGIEDRIIAEVETHRIGSLTEWEKYLVATGVGIILYKLRRGTEHLFSSVEETNRSFKDSEEQREHRHNLSCNNAVDG